MSTLSAALEEFRQALVRRWREHVCQAVLDGQDYPTTIRAQARSGYQPPWDYRHPHAQAHLIGRGQHCDYVAWINAGQDGALESVACAGTCEGTGEPEPIPATIECGMYQILRPVDDWAWEERRNLFAKLPLFAHHNEAALRQAHDDMVQLAKQLGLQPSGSDTTPGLTNPTGLPDTIDLIAYEQEQRSSWSATWASNSTAERLRSTRTTFVTWSLASTKGSTS